MATTKKTQKKNALVMMQLEHLRKEAAYREDVPLHWMQSDHGKERALVNYVERLEADNKKLRAQARKLEKLVAVLGKCV